MWTALAFLGGIVVGAVVLGVLFKMAVADAIGRGMRW